MGLTGPGRTRIPHRPMKNNSSRGSVFLLLLCTLQQTCVSTLLTTVKHTKGWSVVTLQRAFWSLSDYDMFSVIFNRFSFAKPPFVSGRLHVLLKRKYLSVLKKSI